MSLVLHVGAGEVVGNDLDADGEALVVITGADQGGKSTFFRALGQAQLMMQAGMFVAAESFASTNEGEGSGIARQVLRALGEAGIRTVFVTHLYDLAGRLYAQHDPAMLFLRAERRDEGRRTFRLPPGEPLPTSYGHALHPAWRRGRTGPGPADRLLRAGHRGVRGVRRPLRRAADGPDPGRQAAEPAQAGALATTRLGRPARLDALADAAQASLASFSGALLPLGLAVAFPAFGWLPLALALLMLMFLGVIIGRRLSGHPVVWAIALAAAGVVLVVVGAVLNIA